MKILLTGSKGFIGKNVYNALTEYGHDVVEFDLECEKPFDIRNYESVKSKMIGCEAVVHLAAYLGNDKKLCWEHNVTGSKNIAYCASKNYNIKKVIIASSAAVYGNNINRYIPCYEGDDLAPINEYGFSKQIMENIFNFYCLSKLCTLRLFNVYGNGQNNDAVISKWMRAASMGLSVGINGDGLSTRDYVYVMDVVNVITKLVIDNIVGTFNVGTGNSLTLMELLDEFSKLYGRSINWRNNKKLKLEIDHSKASLSLYKKYFHNITPINKGLKLTKEWYDGKLHK